MSRVFLEVLRNRRMESQDFTLKSPTLESLSINSSLQRSAT
jgi:hypothetical protein